jgi:RNA polymerase sigma-70 factor, ECF subfamily
MYKNNQRLDHFDKIYKENYRAMHRVASKILNKNEAIADIVQDVFICLYHAIENQTSIKHAPSWLYRVTYNKCIDYLRGQKRFQNIDTVKDFSEDDETLERNETIDIVQHTLSKLKADEKMLVVLYSEGLSYKEIAQVTGIRFSSVGKMLSRALNKVENELKKEHHDLFAN